MTPRRRCSEPECSASFPHHMWGQIRAQDRGWFLQKDGTAWCPDHLPEWLEAWRARREENK